MIVFKTEEEWHMIWRPDDIGHALVAIRNIKPGEVIEYFSCYRHFPEVRPQILFDEVARLYNDGRAVCCQQVDQYREVHYLVLGTTEQTWRRLRAISFSVNEKIPYNYSSIPGFIPSIEVD